MQPEVDMQEMEEGEVGFVVEEELGVSGDTVPNRIGEGNREEGWRG